MDIPVIDKSNYLKGLLIIARKDNKLVDSEKSIIRGIGEKLGFAQDFYEDTLKSLLANKYIKEDPIIFSNKEIAESFVEDGLKLAYSDNEIAGSEIDWLRMTAIANEIDEEWFNEKINTFKNAPHLWMSTDFALFSLI